MSSAVECNTLAQLVIAVVASSEYRLMQSLLRRQDSLKTAVTIRWQSPLFFPPILPVQGADPVVDVHSPAVGQILWL